MKNPSKTLLRLGAVALIVSLWLMAPATGQTIKERAVAIRGATIETIANGTMEKGIIVIRDGKIEAVGAEVEIPDDARVVEGKGMTIMPGIIDPLSRVGGVAGGGDFTRVADEFYPYQPGFKELLPYGITNISITPASLGQAAVIAIKPDEPKTMVINKEGNLFVPATNSTTSLDVLRDGLALRPVTAPRQEASTQVRAGRGQRRGRDQQQQQRQRGGQRGGQRAEGQSSSEADPLWTKVVNGEQYLIIEAANSATILYLSKILEEHPKVKVALSVSGSSVFETIEALKKFKPLLILSPRIDNQPNRQYRINAARMAHEAGLEVAIFGLKAEGGGAGRAGGRGGRGGFGVAAPSRRGGAVNRDVPLFAVGYLVKAGLPRDVALKALTVEPAKVLGLTERLGTIEPKKDANLLMFNGDPLDPGSRLLRVMVEGKFVYEN